METKEILEKSIQKAISNGLKLIAGDINISRIDCEDLDKMYIHFWDNETNESDMFSFNLWKIIFSHEFAKAFWGSKTIYDERRDVNYRNWEWNLEKMVLEEFPIKYLEKFL